MPSEEPTPARPSGLLAAAAAGILATVAAHGASRAAAFAAPGPAPARQGLRGPGAATPRVHGIPDLSAAPLAAASLAALAAAAARAVPRRRSANVQLCAEPEEKELPQLAQYTELSPEEWFSRVKMVAGDRAIYEVTIPKPLGLKPANFPNRPGVGVATIAPDGNTDEHNRKVLLESHPAMFVLEGDEVVAVNGTSVEGKSLDEVGPLVKESKGDSVTLTLVRYYNAGPIKVIFIPSAKTCTMKRGSDISQAARVGVEEVGYNCKEGWCQSCWQTDPVYNIIYRACAARSKRRAPPKNPRQIPKKWVNVLPLTLLNWDESIKRMKVKDSEREAMREELRKNIEELA